MNLRRPKYLNIDLASRVLQLVVARLILGMGIQTCTVAAPAYIMEVSPPQWRGRMTGIYNCGYFSGSIPAAAITFGCNYIDSNLSWQVPLIFQAAACVGIIGLVFFVPESPSELVMFSVPSIFQVQPLTDISSPRRVHDGSRSTGGSQSVFDKVS